MVLASQVQHSVTSGVTALGPQATAAAAQSSGAGSLDLKHMPDALAGLVREAYGDATGHIFLIAAFVALVALVAVLFIKEVPLRSTVSLSTSAEEGVAAGIAGVTADQSSPSDARFSRQPGRHRYPRGGRAQG